MPERDSQPRARSGERSVAHLLHKYEPPKLRSGLRDEIEEVAGRARAANLNVPFVSISKAVALVEKYPVKAGPAAYKREARAVTLLLCGLEMAGAFAPLNLLCEAQFPRPNYANYESREKFHDSLDEREDLVRDFTRAAGRDFKAIRAAIGPPEPKLNLGLRIVGFAATRLKIDNKTREAALKIMKSEAEAGGADKRGSTVCMCAAAIYIAGLMTGERRSQKEIADVCGITEVSVRNYYQEIASKQLNKLVE